MNKANNVQVLGEVAAKVIEKYKADPFERIRVIYNRELRPFQLEWWLLMDSHPDVVCKACPRIGKTYLLAMRNLDEMVCYGGENLMVAAPKYDQAVETFRPAQEIIEESEVLKAFVKRNSAGKMEFGKGFVEFINRSNAKCFGVTSNFEGFNASILHVDETDDIPPDLFIRLFGRTIGANVSGLPTRKRLSGVIWGRLNIFRFESDPGFFTLPGVDVYRALAGGYLEKKAVLDARAQMTADEWLRTMCLIYVEARNLIWESWLTAAQYLGLQWELAPVPPLPGAQYRKKGALAIGLDMGHQGGGDDASEYALQVVEAVGKYRRWVWGRTWPPDTDPSEIITDLCEYWDFYRPDLGYSDALDANLAAMVNEELYNRGLTYYNWKIKGRNDLEGWKDWARKGLLTPIHNSGRVKYYMYQSLRNAIYNAAAVSEDPVAAVFVFPQIDREKSRSLPGWKELQQSIRELGNLVGEKLPSGYLRIERHKKKDEQQTAREFGESAKLGDDRADALAMANHALDYLLARKSAGGVLAPGYLKGF